MIRVYETSTYIVRWTMSIGSHEHEIALHVGEPDLDAFLRTLRFNDVPKFSAERKGGDAT